MHIITRRIGSDRFSHRSIVLSNMNSEAVLDRETGLVWERSPDTYQNGVIWSAAFDRCYIKRTGGREGWRLPTINELASLADANVYVPIYGSPFNFAQVSTPYWSSTTDASDPTRAYGLSVFSKPNIHTFQKIFDYPVWCVRGGQAIDSR
jgi:hypothetical protein